MDKTVVGQDDPKVQASVGQTGQTKEIEMQKVEIKSYAEKLESQMAESIKGSVSEAALSRPEPKLPPDVEDAGVKSPAVEASKVIEKGTTLELPMTEDSYKKGQKVSNPASSLLALVTWIGKIIKLAHKHTMKVIFRKAGEV